MIGMGWDDSLFFPLEESFLESSKWWTCETIIEQCTCLLRPMQWLWEKWFVVSSQVGWEDKGCDWFLQWRPMHLKHFSSVLFLHQPFQYLVSQTQMPLSDLLNYSKVWPLESKQLHEADKSLESPTPEAELWQSETTNPWWRQWTWPIPLQLPMQVGSLSLFLGNKCSTHPFKRKLEIIFGERDACPTLPLLKKELSIPFKRRIVPGEACCFCWIKLSFIYQTTKILRTFSRNSFSYKNVWFSQNDIYINRPVSQSRI